MHSKRRLSGATLAVLAALLAACSGPGTTQSNPAQVLREAGHAMSGVKSLKADTRFGSGVTLQGLTLTTAASSIELPDQSDTTFKVKQGDFLVDVRVVTSGGHVYLRLPFSRFTELSAEQAAEIPDLSRLFDPQTGLPAVLPQGRNSSSQGTEKIGDAECDKVTTSYTAADVGRLLGVTPAGTVNATVWAGRPDHLVRRVIMAGPLLQAGKNVQVQVDLHDFNRPVNITAPSAAPPAAAPSAAASASPSPSP